MHAVVVRQNAVRGPFEIVELTASCGPPEASGDEQREHDGQRDQQEEDVHSGSEQKGALRGQSKPYSRARTRTSGSEQPTFARNGKRRLAVSSARAPVAPAPRRHALPTTISDDADMPAAAASGER